MTQWNMVHRNLTQRNNTIENNIKELWQWKWQQGKYDTIEIYDMPVSLFTKDIFIALLCSSLNSLQSSLLAGSHSISSLFTFSYFPSTSFPYSPCSFLLRLFSLASFLLPLCLLSYRKFYCSCLLFSSSSKFFLLSHFLSLPNSPHTPPLLPPSFLLL